MNFETAVLSSGADHAYGHSDFQRGACESAFCEFIWTRQLAGPRPSFSKRRIIDVDEHIRVRIHPVDITDDTAECYRLGTVEFSGNRVVRGEGCRYSSDQED